MKPQIPWLRVFVEGVVIVGSILLAFGIQAWWDGVQEREEEQEILSALRQELISNADSLSKNAGLHDLWAQQATLLLEAASGEAAPLPPDSVDHLLASLSAWAIPSYQRAALDVSLAGAGSWAVRDHTLRQQIAAWSVALDRVIQQESDLSYFERWMDFLREHAYLPQVWNVGLDRVAGWQTSRMPSHDSVDHAELLGRRDFVNLLVERKMVHEDILLFHNLLRQNLDGLLAALDRGLDF